MLKMLIMNYMENESDLVLSKSNGQDVLQLEAGGMKVIAKDYDLGSKRGHMKIHVCCDFRSFSYYVLIYSSAARGREKSPSLVRSRSPNISRSPIWSRSSMQYGSTGSRSPRMCSKSPGQ